MKGRRRTLAIVLGAAAAAVVVARHGRRFATERPVPGGILIGDTGVYDALSGLVLGSFFAGVADDVAALAPSGARVLEVGCGPGRLSIRLARRDGLDVTGLDLDPAMIARARANVARARTVDGRLPAFLVGDVTSLAFGDGTFDLVVSTLSLHHWTDPTAGLTEIARVLRPGGRALVWDLRPGVLPLHGDLPDPVEHTHGAPLRVERAGPWRWPWRFELTRRIELVRTG